MSPVSAAPSKSARMSGRARRRASDAKPHSPEADRLLDFLRTELIDLKQRLGWSYDDIGRRLGPTGRVNARARTKQGVEQMLKSGGFGSLVNIARAMGVRVTVDLR